MSRRWSVRGAGAAGLAQGFPETMARRASPCSWVSMGYHGRLWASKGMSRPGLELRQGCGGFVMALRRLMMGWWSLLFVLCSGRAVAELRRHRGNRAGKIARRPVSRVLSGLAAGTAIPLGRALRRASRDQPGRRDGNVPAAPAFAGPPAAPIRSCSRWGLPCRRRCRRRGALLPPRFTLARGGVASGRGRFVFCGTFPGVAPAGR